MTASDGNDVAGAKKADSPRVVMFGYSEVGYQCLELLLQRGVAVVGVFTHDDDPGEQQWFKSVAALAQRNGIPVFKPHSLRGPEWQQTMRDLAPDLILSLYYRNMIPMRLLEGARLGAFNMHGSVLPRYRGRAPLNWAIIHGEDHTGVTLHVMEASADTGAIVDFERIPVGPEESVADVLPRIPPAAVSVLGRQLDALLRGTAPQTPQDHSKATYFGRRTPADGQIDWSRDCRAVFNFVRAITRPFPGAFADLPEPYGRISVWWGRPVEDGDSRALPGTVLAADPLTIQTGRGSFVITDWERQYTIPAAGEKSAS